MPKKPTFVREWLCPDLEEFTFVVWQVDPKDRTAFIHITDPGGQVALHFIQEGKKPPSLEMAEKLHRELGKFLETAKNMFDNK